MQRRNVTTLVSTTFTVTCTKCKTFRVELKDVAEHNIDDVLREKHNWSGWGDNLICPKCREAQIKEFEKSEDIRERIAAGVYKTKLPYKGRKEDATAWGAYNSDQDKLDRKFQEDALKSVGLVPRTKTANACWSFAWEHGHSSGDSDILTWLGNAVDLIKASNE